SPAHHVTSAPLRRSAPAPSRSPGPSPTCSMSSNARAARSASSRRATPGSSASCAYSPSASAPTGSTSTRRPRRGRPPSPAPPSPVPPPSARRGPPGDAPAVTSVHGRPLARAARHAARPPRVAALTAPAAPPEALGRELLALGAPHRRAAVCARLGEPEERVDVVTLEELAAGAFDALSVVVLLDGDGVASGPTLMWGRPESGFAARDGLVTKGEVRAVVLGKLALPTAGVVWDVGAGSGSVAIETAALAPGGRVFAVEQHASDAARITENARAHGVAIDVVHATAPDALGALPDPDRVFVGGGGSPVLDAVLARLRPDGRVVATFAAVDRAAAAY